MKIPKQRPDGAFIGDKPPNNSTAERKNFKVGDKVSGTYHDFSRMHMRVSGKIYGFVRNDVMLYDKELESWAWIDGKNVFRL